LYQEYTEREKDGGFDASDADFFPTKIKKIIGDLRRNMFPLIIEDFLNELVGLLNVELKIIKTEVPN
jgi:hypothetical protein